MSRVWQFISQGVTCLALIAALAGCPDERVQIKTNTDELHFGATTSILQFKVYKAKSSRELAPIEVIAADSWIAVLNCVSTAEGCVSNGPLDPIRINVAVDRSKMLTGDNEGSIVVTSQGAVSQTVNVTAFTPAAPAFSASTRTPIENQSVTFTNETQVEPGWTVEGYLWELGEGRTSTQENPPPQAYLNDGTFDISLQVTVSRNGEFATVTAFRADYIITTGIQAPTAQFTVSDTEPLVDNPVFFTDQSFAGTSPIVAWEWNFGDGTSSIEQNPTHVFTSGGDFTVTLRVSTVDGSDTASQVIRVEVRPPQAEFSASTTSALVNLTIVQFTDLSEPGSAPIENWSWDFGDLGTSSDPNPIHIYTQPGTYTVSLTVTTDDGVDTETKANLITATTLPPDAAFDASNRRPIVGDTVTFTDESDPGTAPAKPDPNASRIDTWSWVVTDPDTGTTFTSSQENPQFTFTEVGMFDVSLTVTTIHGSDSRTIANFIGIFEGTALDRYVRKPDDSFNASYLDDNLFSSTIVDPNGLFTAHVQDMTSQTWRTTADVDQPIWNHWVTIIEPTVLTHTRALLIITGGSDDDEPPSSIDPNFAAIAVQTESVVATLNAVPNQPLNFTGDPLSPRSEDAIIAYTFDQFLDTGDEEWPVLLPMTKAAVRAMDVVQGFLREENDGEEVIEDFIVTGASKRGWTTWLTGAVDGRVKAISPLVYDALNFRPQLKHHFDVYGFFSEAIFDYVEAGLFGPDNSPDGFFSRFDSAEGMELLDIVDPYEYRERYFSVPKLLINSPGDQFFVPDSAQFYFRPNSALVVGGFDAPLNIAGLPGEKKLSYIPNVDHSLGNLEGVVEVFLPWYLDVLNDRPLPQFNWRFNAQDNLIVTVTDTPSNSLQWLATSFNRDFRLDESVNQFPIPVWSSTAVAVNFQNEIVTNVAPLFDRFTGYFVQVEFPNSDPELEVPLPHRYTTEVVITPDTIPAHDFVAPVASLGVQAGSSVMPDIGEPVQFADMSAPGSGPVIRWLWDFGDGDISREPAPSHSYDTAGSFDVTLTVTTVHGSDSETRMDFIMVQP